MARGRYDAIATLKNERAAQNDKRRGVVSFETARLKRAQAEKCEIENALRRGELLTRDLVNEMTGICMAVVARMLTALDRRLPPLVVGQDLTTTRIKIRDEVNAVRQAAADELTALATPRKTP
ncbi:MAG: hypothetical protein V3U43_03160 [Pseudomonadales bacterium]